jgi:hypothetical protein
MQRYDQHVPFVPNPDATHCYQAALKMVLQRFRPHRDPSWADLDRITGKVEGFGTWPFAGLTWLRELELELTNVELMDNVRQRRQSLYRGGRGQGVRRVARSWSRSVTGAGGGRHLREEGAVRSSSADHR